MFNHLTSRFSKILTLLVGVCLIGTAFHIHQLHPDYTLQDSNNPHHLSVDQPDCVACMNLMQALADVHDTGNTIRDDFISISLLSDQILILEFVSDLNNKSPPV
ncbi:hypothetical protein [Fodinibius sp. Rm-B-1B1-1]|uniref:hypothetical protein n=1 Tax=Fodinibius alkaliphilus TaxID=3140241 RepID=UPI00315A2687